MDHSAKEIVRTAARPPVHSDVGTAYKRKEKAKGSMQIWKRNASAP